MSPTKVSSLLIEMNEEFMHTIDVIYIKITVVYYQFCTFVF